MKHIINTAIAVLLFVFSLGAQDTIKVGISHTPPFIQKDGDKYEGASIFLWERIADSLNITFEYVEYPLSSICEALDKKEINLSISPMTVTKSRIKKYYFSQPYYITSLAYAVRAADDGFFMTFLSDFFSWNFFKAFFSLFSIIFIFGLLIWLIERRRNKEFRKGHKGLGDGIWWSAVTMSTVGYGDKTPSTFLGRSIAVVWMFTAVVVISGLTASISSSLTVNKLKTEINSIDDLRKVKVGTVANSGSSEFLDEYRIKYDKYSTVEEGIDALNASDIDAFVFDDAVLSYYVRKNHNEDEVKVIPSAYFKEYFSIASTNGSLIDKIDVCLISIVESRLWKKELEEYHIEYRD